MKTSLKRFPILRRLVSKSNNLLPISIVLSKMKRPMMIHKLVFLKKSKRLKHYNYGFLGEYQFDSPSSTPLIHYYNPNTSIHDIYSMLFWCKCFGSLKVQVREEADHLQPAPMALPLAEEIDFEDGDYSVDERAERFIENFYAEMRLQRQESF
ncbi:hypothetical protein V6N13_125614 [Hibiscus sabdariffa]|uniref:Uncharacterized protein n=1 Tax=Hibiscus sabdariffa TaxID=183260 RepID=A0ABR2U6U9_9ROSI